MLSPPKKIRAQDDLQKEAATTQRKEAQDVCGSIGEQGEGRSHDLQKEPEVQLKKYQDMHGSIGERGEGRTNDPHKQVERGPKVTYEINMPRARIFVDCTDDSDDEHCKPNRRPPTNTEVERLVEELRMAIKRWVYYQPSR